MTLQIDIEWPAALPLPVVDYTGNPLNGTLVSPIRNLAILRRSRFYRTYATLRVGWMLSHAQYLAFKDFLADDIDNGAAHFKIELRYPQNSELAEWEVVFLGEIQATHLDGLWEVSSALQLVNPVKF